MLDLVFIIATVACFATSLLYVQACARLKGKPTND